VGKASVRDRIQGFLQALLEEEVTTVLGRRRSERRRAIDARPGRARGSAKLRYLRKWEW
jgi:hypothetical protein